MNSIHRERDYSLRVQARRDDMANLVSATIKFPSQPRRFPLQCTGVSFMDRQWDLIDEVRDAGGRRTIGDIRDERGWRHTKLSPASFTIGMCYEPNHPSRHENRVEMRAAPRSGSTSKAAELLIQPAFIETVGRFKLAIPEEASTTINDFDVADFNPSCMKQSGSAGPHWLTLSRGDGSLDFSGRLLLKYTA